MRKDKILIATAILVIFATIMTIVACSNNKGFDTSKYITKSYRVIKGDTLWHLAKDFKAEEDSIYDYMAAIKRLNYMDTSELIAGDCIYIYVLK